MPRIPQLFAGCLLALLASAGWAQNWSHYGGDAHSTKFAPLDQVTVDNFNKLQILWHWRPTDFQLLKNNPDIRSNRYVSTPVVVDGVLFASSPLNIVTALSGASGEVLWEFDPGAWRERGDFRGLHRGVSYWRQGDQARVVFGSGSAYLYSLDAETGRPDPAFGDSGRVDLTQGLRRSVERGKYAVISPPIVVGEVIVVGSSVSDVRGRPVPKNLPPGDVRGFDRRTGEQLWVFETIPQPGQFGHETWGEESWRDFGGANVWTMMSADPELGYVYLPISTPSNDFYGGERPGDNLFGDSIVCLDAATGQRVWHFQLIHHGLWDYDPPAAPVLLDITVGGQPIKAVAQVSKQGFVYVFDRVSGQPVWPIEEMPVPRSSAAGEEDAPTQPVPSWPPPFTLQGLEPDDLIDFTPQLRHQALQIIKEYRYGPLFSPPSEEGTIFLPGLLGGADWAGAAAHPPSGMLYVPSHVLPFVVQLNKVDDPQAPSAYGASVRTGLDGPEGLPLTKPPYGQITAIDLNSGIHHWVRPTGRGPVDHPALAGLAIEGDLGWPSRIFPLVTSTLLVTAANDPRTFEGLWAGNEYFVDPEPYLRAWDLTTGASIGRVELPGNAAGGPATYMAEGRQFFVVPLGEEEGRPTELVGLALPRRGDKLPPQAKGRRDADHKNYYKAVRALDRGDYKALAKFLKKDSKLARARGYMHQYYQYPGFRGATLLHHVAGNPMRVPLPANALELAQLLLERGADPDAITLDSLTTIDLAISGAQLEWAEQRNALIVLLLEGGADPNRNNGKMMWDALIASQKDLAEALLANGAKVDLRFAAGLGRLDLMARFFTESGRLKPQGERLYFSKPDSVRSEQEILNEALNFAAFGGHQDGVDFLLERGADINGLVGYWWSWDMGTTAMHKVVDTENMEMLRFLVERGADPTVRDARWGETVYQWSTYFPNKDVQELLKELEAKYLETQPAAEKTVTP